MLAILHYLTLVQYEYTDLTIHRHKTTERKWCHKKTKNPQSEYILIDYTRLMNSSPPLSSRKNHSVATLSYAGGDNGDSIPAKTSLCTPSNHSDHTALLQQFLTFNIHKWIQFIHTISLQLEEEWGGIKKWESQFSEEWSMIHGRDLKTIKRWVAKVSYFIKWGHWALWYIEKVMEGEVVMSIGEWYDICELLTTTLTSVHILEYKLGQLK